MRSGGIELLNIDCLDLLKSLPDASVDLMLTDPPYGITQNDWDKPINLAAMWLEWERVVKPNGAFVFTSAEPFASDLIVSRRGLFKYDLIWHKPLGSGFLNANKMPLRNHENILVFYRQLPTYNPQMGVGVNKKGVRKKDRTGDNYGNFADTNPEKEYFDDGGKRFPNSVIYISNGNRNHDNNIHPTQKPVDLMRYFIRTYTNPGETVFDGYSGSGTTAEACILEGRKFIGSELNKEYYDKSIERLSIVLSKPQLVFP